MTTLIWLIFDFIVSREFPDVDEKQREFVFDAMVYTSEHYEDINSAMLRIVESMPKLDDTIAVREHLNELRELKDLFANSTPFIMDSLRNAAHDFDNDATRLGIVGDAMTLSFTSANSLGIIPF